MTHDSTIQRTLAMEPLRLPLLRKIIRSLRLPRGSMGLDAGCGTGHQATLLAEAAGQICGLDISLDSLLHAAQSAGKNDLRSRVHFALGDYNHLPFKEASFDWAWSADCIGYPAADLLPTLRELRRVVKPGGRIFLLAWSAQQVLPGYPLLEARLNAASSGYAPFLQGKRPEDHYLRALAPFTQAGLKRTTAHTYLGEVQSPLDAGERKALLSLFEMLWGDAPATATEADQAAYRRLCQPTSSDCILDVPGYYAFFSYTLFCGSVPR